MDIQVDGFNISGVYNTTKNFGKAEPLNAFFKVGAYSVDTEVDGLSEGSTGLSFGLGLEYAFTNHFSARIDFEGLSGVEDFANDETVTLFTAAIQVLF